MERLAELFDNLACTQSRNRKIALLGQYFRDEANSDRGWTLAGLTDGVPVRLPLRRMLSELTSDFIDPVLYRLSRDYVGDTAETVSLLWPDPDQPPNAMPSVDDVIRAMQSGTTETHAGCPVAFGAVGGAEASWRCTARWCFGANGTDRARLGF